MVILFLCTTGLIFESDSIFKIDSVYRNYYLFVADSGFPLQDSFYTRMPEMEQKDDRSELRISGIKDFIFDIDRGFEQGLKLYVNGEIEGVKVKGTLSDQGADVPTRRISDIEKMRLELWTNSFYGGIGDLSLNLPFGIYDEIEGARLGIGNEANNINVSYALSRGQYQRFEFDGEEGKQGPYFITGPIVYGSERVFVSDYINRSQLLISGEDYNIDYEQGIIIFTNKNIITHNTHIVVEYQKVIQDYLNIYQEADAQISMGNLSIGSIFHRSFDDKDNPLSFRLTSSEIESLSLSGDSTRITHIYADTSANGNYVLVDDHFVYVGEGKGNYLVTFFYVGENNGDYEYDPGIKGFVYKGTNQGNYTPEKLVPLPRDNQFYAIGLRHGAGLAGNVYGSFVDKNRFSAYDDSDNLAGGYEVNFDRDTRRFSVHGKYLHFEDDFYQPRGREGLDYSIEWNTTDRLKELAQVVTGIAIIENINFEIGYGVLNRNHRRRSLMLRPFFLHLGYEEIDTLQKYIAGFKNKIGKTSFNLQYVNQDMNHFTDYRLYYSLRENIGVGLTGNYERNVNGRAILTKFNFDSRPIILSAGNRFLYDTTLFFVSGNFNINYHHFFITGDVEQSQKYGQKKDEIYIKVKEGTGNYIYDPVTGTYIQKSNGDYIKQVVLLADFQKVVSRRYYLEPIFAWGLVDLRSRLFYLDEEDFMDRKEEVNINLEKNEKHFELNFSDNFSKDARYALEPITRVQYSFSLHPGYKKFYTHYTQINQREKWGEFLKEKRTDHKISLDLEINEDPQVKPYTSYGLSSIYTEFFPDFFVILHASSTGLFIAKPIRNNGRIELDGEFVYRQYNIDEIPYFFSASEPPGLSKVLTFSSAFGFGNNTVLSVFYRLQLSPSEKPVHNLRFQTRIKF